MATLAVVLEELADAIRTSLASVTDVSLQVEPLMVLAPTPPCIDMYPADPSADENLAAFGELVGGELVTVRARVSTADTDAGQSLLLALMDDEDELSLAAALDGEMLGGLASAVHLRARSGYREFPDLSGEGALLGCLWSYVIVKARS
jgi:hypothetical protein